MDIDDIYLVKSGTENTIYDLHYYLKSENKSKITSLSEQNINFFDCDFDAFSIFELNDMVASLKKIIGLRITPVQFQLKFQCNKIDELKYYQSLNLAPNIYDSFNDWGVIILKGQIVLKYNNNIANKNLFEFSFINSNIVYSLFTSLEDFGDQIEAYYFIANDEYVIDDLKTFLIKYKGSNDFSTSNLNNNRENFKIILNLEDDIHFFLTWKHEMHILKEYDVYLMYIRNLIKMLSPHNYNLLNEYICTVSE